MADARQQLLERLSVLHRLNPDLAFNCRDELLALARQVPPVDFPRFAEFATGLIAAYQTSPWKNAEQSLLREYFHCLEQATARLLAAGELRLEAPSQPATPTSVSLVPPRAYDSLDWCRLQARAGISTLVQRAVDAARNRNRLAASVLETMFAVLQAIDRDRSIAWHLEFIAANQGKLDADVVRDLLVTWLHAGTLPAAAFEWVMHWSEDETLARQWPAVVDRADAVLRRRALRSWAAASRSGQAGVIHLRQLVAQERFGEEELERWLWAGITDIGERVHFFLSLSETMFADVAPAELTWRRAALLREIEALAVLFLPVLVLADLVLRMPSGAYRFAMAFFGLSRSTEDAWRERLHQQAEKNIRRMFLLGMKNRRPVVEIVRRLCFGDKELFEQLQLQLDFGTKEFDSVRQLAKVSQRLAVHYISRREAVLLASEVARRYRALVRVMHEDNLGRLLTAEQLAEVRQLTVFRDVMAIITDARRFLARRRDLDMSIEDMVASEMDFVRDIRVRRHHLLRPLVFGEAAAQARG